jgi:hypothetical protein
MCNVVTWSKPTWFMWSDFILKRSELRWSSWGQNCHVHWSDFMLRVKKVKWSRYRPHVAQRMGRGIGLLFHDRGTRRGWVLSSSPRSQFTPGKDPLCWGYLIKLWLFHWGISCTVVVLICFVMCGCVCVCVCVGFVMCGCFGDTCNCIYCVFVLFCFVCTMLFVLFRLCIYIFICFVFTSVRTTATEWQLNCSYYYYYYYYYYY